MIVLLEKELKANWRSFRYPAFLLIILFFALLDPLMLKYMNEILGQFATGIEIIMPDPTPEDAYFSYLSDVSQIGILILIFSTMGIVAREKETGVTGWLLSKPVGRWQYLFAKLLILYGLVIVGIIAGSALAYLYTTSLIGQPPLNGSVMATLNLVIFTLFIATLTYTLSTVLKSPLQTGGITLLIFFMGGIINMLISDSAAAKFYPNTLLTQMKSLLDGTVSAAECTNPITVTIVLIVLLILLSGIRFSRLEL
jgi:ABC-2 type transport system permease protein